MQDELNLLEEWLHQHITALKAVQNSFEPLTDGEAEEYETNTFIIDIKSEEELTAGDLFKTLGPDEVTVAFVSGVDSRR